ncbi:inactive protein kinase SELMODRAFT_444075-like isoform X1 [Primulina huaijiensis]|uniref:inactive protein kinase SELMODRAFT_444075-like isoform X1 n=1 Tax=Primulina huaijiensis TaxID=1492673 RepID=UPI003CC6F38B
MFPPKTEAANRRGVATAERVIVAVKVEKVISKVALAWALTHAVRPGDCVTLLAIVSPKKTDGRRFWGFSRLKGDCRSNVPALLPDRIGRISESCSQMVLKVQDQIQVRVQIKVISATSAGAVVAEAKSNAANWVILDKKLKEELKLCIDELHCNIVVMKGSQPKVLRLNLASSNDPETPFYSTTSSPIRDFENLHSQNMKHTTPVSSPEDPNTSCTRTSDENSLSSSDTGASVFVVYEQNPLYDGVNKNKNPLTRRYVFNNLSKRIINVSENMELAACRNQRIFWITQNDTVDEKSPATVKFNNISKTAYTSSRKELDNVSQYKEDNVRGPVLNEIGDGDYVFDYSIRDAVSLGKTCPTPPPLCSLCQSKAPAFGKPTKKFHYKELEEATNGFSATNFVAEGVLGLVHRGVLNNGLVIAVKRLKFSGPQREDDFCREVRVLSCAQHRNVVLLIGFCIEGNKRLLVYEYICNSSLDFHLHGNKRLALDWQARLKIAIGTARGLRYLHEDCRVGCIIHGKLRPTNILLTHDFEPLVADFGVARLNSEWEFCYRNQVVGTSGYLAPECFSDGKLTEKVDIYAFGLVLLELITSQRAHDMQYFLEHQFLLHNIHALSAIEPIHILAYKHQLLDPHLASYQIQGLPYELHAIGWAASLCLQQDPDLRPPMSKVVKMLEGGNQVASLSLDMASVGCRSGHMQGPTNSRPKSKRMHSRRFSY